MQGLRKKSAVRQLVYGCLSLAVHAAARSVCVSAQVQSDLFLLQNPPRLTILVTRVFVTHTEEKMMYAFGLAALFAAMVFIGLFGLWNLIKTVFFLALTVVIVSYTIEMLKWIKKEGASSGPGRRSAPPVVPAAPSSPSVQAAPTQGTVAPVPTVSAVSDADFLEQALRYHGDQSKN